jgi:hypothetical protein
VALLGKLGVVERIVGMLEIGARVLLVGVEEERIEPVVEIVMVRDVASRAARPVEPSMRWPSTRASRSAMEPSSTCSVPSM